MRNYVIDVIKGISIIMIVNVHLVTGQFFELGKTYHVIAFFVVSGIIHGINEKWQKQSFRSLVLQRAKRLGYPYLTLSICYIVFRIILNIVRQDTIINDVVVNSSVNFLLLRGIGTLWFLPVLFGGELIFLAAKKLRIGDYSLMLCGIISIIVSSWLDRNYICGSSLYGVNSLYGLLVNNPLSIILASVIACSFIAFGCYIAKHLPEAILSDNWKGRRGLLLILICIVSFCVDYCFVGNYVGDLHKLRIGSPIIFLVCTYSGVIFVMSLSILIVNYIPWLSRLLSFCGKESLIIMTTHSEYMINSIVYVLITFVLGLMQLDVNAKFISLISLAFILLIEFFIIYIIEHTKLKHIYNIPEKYDNLIE